jgi:hypothetical protein
MAGGAADSLKGGGDGLRSGEGVESYDDDENNEDDDDEYDDDEDKDDDDDDGDDDDDPSKSSCAFDHCRRNKSRFSLFLILIRE